jgi:hypothetical protein
MSGLGPMIGIRRRGRSLSSSTPATRSPCGGAGTTNRRAEAPELLTVAGTALLLRLSRATAYRLVESGEIPAHLSRRPVKRGTHRAGLLRALAQLTESDSRELAEVNAEAARDYGFDVAAGHAERPTDGPRAARSSRGRPGGRGAPDGPCRDDGLARLRTAGRRFNFPHDFPWTPSKTRRRAMPHPCTTSRSGSYSSAAGSAASSPAPGQGWGS